MRNNPGNSDKFPGIFDMESFLATRLTDDTYRGIAHFNKLTFEETPLDQIAQALVSQRQILFRINLKIFEWET